VVELNDPADPLLRACLVQREWIRLQFGELSEMAQGWIPATMPLDWFPTSEDLEG